MVPFVRLRNPILMLLSVVLLGGIFAYNQMKTELLPSITFPKVKVIADNGQQPVDKMMLTVTRLLEEAMKRVPGIHTVRSTTSRGTAEISAFFDWNTDIDLGKQQLESQISQIRSALPAGLSLQVEKMSPSILPIAGYSLEGNMSKMALRELALYTVKPVLFQVQGVSDVAIAGGGTREYHLVLNPIKMTELGIVPQMIADALSQTNFISSNGYLEDTDRLYLSLTDAVVSNLMELEETAIMSTPGRTVRIKDIGEVKIEARREYIRIKANGQDVPLVAVLKQPDANLMEVSAALQQKVAQLNQSLPDGVVLRPYYEQSNFVSHSVRGIQDVLWIGLSLAMIVAVLFLRSLKSSLVLLVTLPVTLGLSLIVLLTLGYEFNIMTLGAIAAAIGLVIDDAIIVVEQLYRSQEEHPDQHASQWIGKSVQHLLPAMIGSSLSTIVIFLPFVLMTGIAGAYFRILTETMIITLVCSFFIAWLGLPTVYLFFSRRLSSRTKPVAHEVKPQSWVRKVVRLPIISFLFLAFLGVSAWLIAPRLPSGFLPEMDEGSIVLDFNSPPGTSLEATDYMLQQVDQILDSTPEVASYSRRTGTQMGFFITEPNRGDYLIQLSARRKKTTVEVTDQIRSEIEATLPALTVDFGQVIGDMLGDLMSSVQPIEIKIFGQDRVQLDKLARQVSWIVEETKGTADVFDGIVIAGPSVEIVPQVETLIKYGLTPSDFQFQLQTQTEGMLVGDIPEVNQMTGIRMKYPGGGLQPISSLVQDQLFLPDGRLATIGNLCQVKIQPGETEIDRENLKSMVAITARLNNRDLGSTLRDIRKSVAAQVSLPEGYSIEYGGEYAQQQQAFQELAMILLSSVLLVFLVMLFLFRKIGVALAIILIAALGAAGSLWALLITGTALNVGSYVGIIMVIGIIGENSIFTYAQFAERRRQSDLDDALVYSISTRLRPKLMTALGAISALMPLALGIGTGAEMHQPLAVAVIGGLIVALPLLLIVLPSLLRLLDQAHLFTPNS